MAFIRKMVFQRKSNAEIKFWGNSNCKLKFLTTTLPLRTYLCTFVVFVTVIIYVQNGLRKRDCVTKNFEIQVIPRRNSSHTVLKKETHAAPSVTITEKHVNNQNL